MQIEIVITELKKHTFSIQVTKEQAENFANHNINNDYLYGKFNRLISKKLGHTEWEYLGELKLRL